MTQIAPDNAKGGAGKRLCVIAGDPSGDIAGFHFMRELKKSIPDVEVFGLGGRRMLAEGQRQLETGEKLAALGFWEVAKRARFFSRLLQKVASEISSLRPNAVVLIDYPGFNLRLAKRIKKLGIPIIYYIAPQVWAWGARRIPEMKTLIDRLLVILPFEVEFFKRHGIAAEYVGHYLLDDIPSHWLGATYNPDSRIITLLPGSRHQEVERMLPVLLETARALGTERWQFRIAGANDQIDFHTTLDRFPEFRESLAFARTRESIVESALVITSSGTATLETALIGRPMIVLYKTAWLTYHIARKLVSLPHIALANIVAEETVAPEFLQGRATGTNIATEARELLGSPERRTKMVERYSSALEKLRLSGAENPAQNVAGIVAEYLT